MEALPAGRQTPLLTWAETNSTTPHHQTTTTAAVTTTEEPLPDRAKAQRESEHRQP